MRSTPVVYDCKRIMKLCPRRFTANDVAIEPCQKSFPSFVNLLNCIYWLRPCHKLKGALIARPSFVEFAPRGAVWSVLQPVLKVMLGPTACGLGKRGAAA